MNLEGERPLNPAVLQRIRRFVAYCERRGGAQKFQLLVSPDLVRYYDALDQEGVIIPQMILTEGGKDHAMNPDDNPPTIRVPLVSDIRLRFGERPERELKDDNDSLYVLVTVLPWVWKGPGLHHALEDAFARAVSEAVEAVRKRKGSAT